MRRIPKSGLVQLGGGRSPLSSRKDSNMFQIALFFLVGIFSVAAIARAPTPAPAKPLAADCRMTVWLKSEVPLEYESACVGSCEDLGDDCEKKTVNQGGTTYYFCKCTQAGTPTEPDSTACTTVVTLSGGVWDHYCYNQACSESCVKYAVRWEHTTPCLCH